MHGVATGHFRGHAVEKAHRGEGRMDGAKTVKEIR